VAAQPAAGILKDENADQPPSATNWIFGTTREVFDEVFDGFSRIVIQVITSSYAFPASINANYTYTLKPTEQAFTQLQIGGRTGTIRVGLGQCDPSPNHRDHV
jgi:hypothetical protein